jgi:hypothetical protein
MIASRIDRFIIAVAFVGGLALAGCDVTGDALLRVDTGHARRDRTGPGR